MNRHEIKSLVLERLAARIGRLGQYGFSVLDERVYQDEEQLWHVPVRPDRPIEERGRFYDLLNSVEHDLEQELHVNVMIVPVAPQEPTSTVREA